MNAIWFFVAVMLATGTIWFVLLIVLQFKSENLISSLKSDKELYKKAGSPSTDYFVTSYLCLMNLKFVVFIIKNKTLPIHVLRDVENYAEIRTLAIILEALHLMQIVVISTVFIWTRVAHAG